MPLQSKSARTILKVSGRIAKKKFRNIKVSQKEESREITKDDLDNMQVGKCYIFYNDNMGVYFKNWWIHTGFLENGMPKGLLISPWFKTENGVIKNDEYSFSVVPTRKHNEIGEGTNHAWPFYMDEHNQLLFGRNGEKTYFNPPDDFINEGGWNSEPQVEYAASRIVSQLVKDATRINDPKEYTVKISM